MSGTPRETSLPLLPTVALERPQRPLFIAGGFILVIAALHFGKELFIPLTLATLLAFALSPVVTVMRRLRLPRVPAVLLAVATAFAVIGFLSYLLATQLIHLGSELPTYQSTMVQKLHALRTSGVSQGGLIEGLTSTFEQLQKELGQQGPVNAAAPGSGPSPMPVRVQPAEQTPVDLLQTTITQLISPLATTGIVIVFVIFVLLERSDIRDRALVLLGAGGNLMTTTAAMSEASERIGRYLLMQLLINLLYGVPIGLALFFLGIPNAILWGGLATIFRFIPFLGPVLAAVCPLTLAFAVDPGWMLLLYVGLLFIGMELLVSNVAEPMLYGHSTGLSSLAILAAAIFWSTLWGTVGLILSTPLTVCLIVIGKNVPDLRFLYILLGSEPVLLPQVQLYQRLLAGNIEDAVEIAEVYLADHTLAQFFQEIALPALRLAEEDRTRQVGAVLLSERMSALITEILRFTRATKKEAAVMVPLRAVGMPDLCIGAKSDLDRAAAQMVSELVSLQGLGSRVLPPISISAQGIGQLDLAGVEVVCLSYLEENPFASVRFVCRRLKSMSPELKILVCLWTPPLDQSMTTALLRHGLVDAIVSSMDEAVRQIDAWVAPHSTAPMQAAGRPDNELERLQAIRDLNIGQGPLFDDVAAKVSAAFHTPIALVTLVNEDRQTWPGAVGLPPKLDVCRFSDRDSSVCGHVVANGEMVVVPDLSKDDRFANNPFILENGLRFYAGAPLITMSGAVIGSLCVIDFKPREFGASEQALLKTIAKEFMTTIHLECHRRSLRVGLVEEPHDLATSSQFEKLLAALPQEED